jgi:hypothetical protein
VERLVEEEAMGLNQTVLSNRQAHAELLRRLRTREVEQQDTWRGAWEKDLERWRLLRMRHTIDAFQARMRSPEFADPPERNEHLASIKRDEVRLERECYLMEPRSMLIVTNMTGLRNETFGVSARLRFSLGRISLIAVIACQRNRRAVS